MQTMRIGHIRIWHRYIYRLPSFLLAGLPCLPVHPTSPSLSSNSSVNVEAWMLTPVQSKSRDRLIQEITLQFIERERAGYSLYMMTLMFGYIPRFFNHVESNTQRIEDRVTVLWQGVMNRLYNRADLSGCKGVVFFDWGKPNSGNGGFHAHMIMALDESRFRSKWGTSFLKYWQEEKHRWVNRRGGSERDILVRSHLCPFDGREAGVRYCAKGGETEIGQYENTMLWLGPPRRKSGEQK